MTTGAHDKAMLAPLEYKIWLALFRVSGVVLICCMLPVVALPHLALPSWLYWLAAGSALLCGLAAYLVRKYEQHEAAGDAAWVVARRERGDKKPWEIDTDD
jgi:hypothetical protein